MKNFIKIVQFILLILASFVILYFYSQRGKLSKNFVSFFNSNDISYAWLLILGLFFFGYFIWKDWNKIQNYNNLNVTDTIQTTILIAVPVLLIITLVLGLIRGDF